MNINGIKLVSVSGNVLNEYRESVKGNETTDELTIRKKLTRNIILSNEVESNSLFEKLIGVRHYTYGNLHIKVWLNHVFEIVNYRGGHHYKKWRKDHNKYDKLNGQLGIE